MFSSIDFRFKIVELFTSCYRDVAGNFNLPELLRCCLLAPKDPDLVKRGTVAAASAD